MTNYSNKRKIDVGQSQYKSKLFKTMQKPKLSLSAKVNRIIQRSEEVKEISSTANVTMTNSFAGPVVYTLNQIAEGSDNNNRIGKRVRFKGCYLDLAFSLGGITDDFGQWWLVQDLQTNGVTCPSTAIMDLTAQPGIAFKNTYGGFGDRFKILAMDVWNCSTSMGTTQHPPKRYIDLKGIETVYGGTTATFPNTNGIYLLFGATNTATSTCRYNVKLTYTDA